ncbi:exported hypothetical protein [Desulfamplus magnetovallimortis]|uniref:Uncharacterized protein n=1 Tax=Desulfamplus magnetovallimortis TaxID=1246637 RepID=A0A1W1H8J4_9BACT|nr:hypothetical protein [Desulfamplus magnetovallimortis]SLM28782.1 exported hypothetical protein [Desulfamplus magnetovallimortis]
MRIATLLIFTTLLMSTTIHADTTNPTIIVAIPEYHISHTVPDPAGETEIVKILIEHGYSVVDKKITAQIKENDKFRAILQGNKKLAVEIGLQFNADVLIVGEAFSESRGQISGFQSCRARLELKAISTKNGKIILSDSDYGSGADTTEFIAGKKAIQSAARKLGRKIVSAFSLYENKISTSKYTISITGIKFEDLTDFEKGIDTISKVKSNSLLFFEQDKASYNMIYEGPVRELARKILQLNKSLGISLSHFAGNQVVFTVNK